MYATIFTPSRLHFGLLRFEQTQGPSYGGLGVMIDAPRWLLTMRPAAVWTATGPCADRALQFAQRAIAAITSAGLPRALSIEVQNAIPEHCGLGGGTQLALAVAAGVRRLAGMPPAGAAELAAMVGRGRRSAVGSHGFVEGGLLWETGRLPHEPVAELCDRLPLPESWRFVLAAPRGAEGLSGAGEQIAFGRLPAAPQRVTERLIELAVTGILPAARAANCDAFGEGVYQYGRLAGECFAPVQGGPYASPQIAECVGLIRALGVRGVGQSSWGPTVFAVVDSPEQAAWLSGKLKHAAALAGCEVQIAAPDNRGAVIGGNDDP